MIRITSKIQSFHPFTFSDISWKFHQNPSISFWFILYTNTSGSLDPDDPDHSQNLITCSLSHLGHFLKISSKSTHDLLSYLSLKLYFMDPEDPDSGPDHSQNWTISSFYHFFLLPFVTYPKNIIKIHPKIMLQPGSRWSRQWSRSLQKCNHLFLVPFRSFAENVITIHR